MGGISWLAGLSVLLIPTGLLLYGENHSEDQAVSPYLILACFSLYRQNICVGQRPLSPLLPLPVGTFGTRNILGKAQPTERT